MEIIEEIKLCQTMRELDELRMEIVEISNANNFKEIQDAFIRKQNSLKRNGHTRWNECYKLSDVC